MGATTSYSSWEFLTKRVQQEVRGGQFVSAESTLIAAGPPDLTEANQFNLGATTSNVTAYPIGLLESFGLQQNRNLQRIFEIGSTRSYFIPGRCIGSVSLGRAFYYGPNLLRVLYPHIVHKANNINIGTKPSTSTIDATAYSPSKQDPQNMLLEGSTEMVHKIQKNPGYDYFFIDLASDLFSNPSGMAVYFKDLHNVTIGAFYLQGCYVQGHQLNISSGTTLIMEGAQLQYDIMTPIQMIT